MKRIIITLALALLPITAIQPAEAGVITCKKRQIKHAPGRYEIKHTCTYSAKGRSY